MTVNDADLRAMTEAELAERRAKALFLHTAGATMAKIATECGVSIATVSKDLRIARRTHTGMSSEDRTARQSAIVSDVLRANYPAMMRGDRDATRNIFDALKREARLFGLDAPTRVLAGVSDIEFANEAAKLIERISAVDPNALKEIERGRDTDARRVHAVIDGEIEPEPVGAADPSPGAVVADVEGGADAPPEGDAVPGGHPQGRAAPGAAEEPWSNL